jgi:hypothetical protein
MSKTWMNHGSRIFFQPEELELGQAPQPADLVQVRNLVLPDVQLLKIGQSDDNKKHFSLPGLPDGSFLNQTPVSAHFGGPLNGKF